MTNEVTEAVNEVAPENKMPNPYLGVTWNSNYYNAVDGDPLQISTTPAALFLKSGSI